MITPSFSLTATERVLPRLALDFTTATLDPRITFTRSGNTATVTNSSGVIVAVNADIPRFDYNPTTLVCNGLLIEESRTNVLLNSLINGTSLATQSVTVTAAARTLSFYGTGQVVLSGVHSATVTGTGAYPARTTLTFTPTAGVLTLTVTGTVQFAQLELGSFVTSFIPTAASQVTRTADVAAMTGTNFSSWFNATESSVVVAYKGQSSGARAFTFSDGTGVNQVWIEPNYTVRAGGVTQYTTGIGAFTYPAKVGVVWKQNRFAVSVNGGAPFTGSSGNVPTLSTLYIGCGATGTSGFLNNCVSSLMYYPQALINNEVRAFSK